MPTLIHQFIVNQLPSRAEKTALVFKDQHFSYSQLFRQIERSASGFLRCGMKTSDRVAIYLPKRPETVFCMFGTAMAGGIFVPVNPLLKAQQVTHILQDCAARVLVTTKNRLETLKEKLPQCTALQSIIVLDGTPSSEDPLPVEVTSWEEFIRDTQTGTAPEISGGDLAALLYTSGSTGHPKGVMLSHQNMIIGAESVVEYLENSASDRLLAALPFSFDYGLSQLTTAFCTGATVVLMDYLLPRDVIRAVEEHQITGLAAVPPLWNPLAQLDWPETATRQLRYITNTGGAMPVATTRQLQAKLPQSKIFLMYGLTEAFRSTYLPPDQIDQRPDSIGKAIPNAEVLVVRPDGSECEVDEPGELIHKGPLVSMGYWNAHNHQSPCFTRNHEYQ